MNPLSAKSGTASLVRPRVDGFDLFVDGVPLLEVRDLCIEEQIKIREYADRQLRWGYFGLFAGVVVWPFFREGERLWHWGSYAVIIEFVAYGFAALTVGNLFRNLPKRVQHVNFYRFESLDGARKFDYLPASEMIWDPDQTSFKPRKLVRVAPAPKQREDSRLTTVEQAELANTIRDYRRYFGASGLICAPWFAENESKKSALALMSADDFVREEDGNEFLSSGVLWTENGKPAQWRYHPPGA